MTNNSRNSSTVETFTADQVAAIAAQTDRVPSSNDLFVRYEDHSAALAAERSPAGPIKLPRARSVVQSRLEGHAVTPENLVATGYTRFDRKGATRSGESGFVTLWQRRIEDDLGTRYFINITEYDYTAFTGKPCEPSFQADVQFRLHDGGVSNVTLSVGAQMIETIERYFARLWENELYVYHEFSSGSIHEDLIGELTEGFDD